MSNLYETIAMLCSEHNITAYKMSQDLGLSKNLVTELKKGRKKGVSAETASKIANYFDVSVDYLLGKTEQKKPLVNNDEELTEYLEELKSRPELKMLFSLAKGATKADVEKAVKIIEALLEKEE